MWRDRGGRTWLPASVDRCSLHLARPPFCESIDVQTAFCDGVADLLDDTVSTLGLHLCGPFGDGMGRLGLGTDFEPSAQNREAARSLLAQLTSRIDRPILLENANSYDRSIPDAVATMQYIGALAAEFGCELILDLAHLALNAHNSGCDPQFLLASVPLERVSVLHLSGIAEGRRQVWHDGHSLPVHDAVWDLASFVLALLPRETLIVIEHTDPLWQTRPADFDADFAQLRCLLDGIPERRVPIDGFQEMDAALHYYRDVLIRQFFPELVSSMTSEELDLLIRGWVEDFLASAGTAPVAVGGRHALSGLRSPVDPLRSFADYANRRILDLV